MVNKSGKHWREAETALRCRICTPSASVQVAMYHPFDGYPGSKVR